MVKIIHNLFPQNPIACGSQAWNRAFSQQGRKKGQFWIWTVAFRVLPAPAENLNCGKICIFCGNLHRWQPQERMSLVWLDFNWKWPASFTCCEDYPDSRIYKSHLASEYLVLAYVLCVPSCDLFNKQVA